MTNCIADLSAAEVECLRLVAEGVTSSKAIATRTSLTPGTIDTYLSRAARTLGVRTRAEAAARYLELLAAPEVILSSPSQQSSQSRLEPIASAETAGLMSVAAGVRWLFSVSPISGPEHSLTSIEKTLAIVRIAAVSLSVVAALAIGGAGLLWIAR